MDWTHVAVNTFQGFFLIIVRIMTILSFVPFFGFRQIPKVAKLGFAYFIALLLVPLIKIPLFPPEPLSYAYLVAQQVLIGIVFGFVSFLFFSAIQVASQIMDIQMGFGLANIIDPISNTQQSIVGQFQFLVAVLFFIAINGHHQLLLAIHKSFQLIPLNGMTFGPKMTPFLVKIVSDMFGIAVQLGLPVFAAVFITDVALGFLARLMPQMNILVLGFPLKIFVGIVAIIVSLGFYLYIYPDVFQRGFANVSNLLELLKP